jgi:hypothetical protein
VNVVHWFYLLHTHSYAIHDTVANSVTALKQSELRLAAVVVTSGDSSAEDAEMAWLVKEEKFVTSKMVGDRPHAHG